MRMRDAGSRAVVMEPEVEDILASYNWPGNVRQLENVLNRACIMADGELITLADLPSEVSSSQVSPARYGTKLAGSGNLRDQLRDIEASLIRQAMDAASGDRRLAAQRLGIGLSSLYRKLEELKVLV
jgi:DNA-binding NtrC family response regulator